MYGYDPARVEALHRRTYDAVAALAAIRSDDPAAADAVGAVNRMRDNLERTWIPLIDAIRTSTAMTAWRAAITGGLPAAAPLTTWITSNGLDHLRDAEIVERLHREIERLRAVVVSGGDVERAHRELAVIVEEAVRRSRHDTRRFAAVIADRLGDRGAVAMLGAIDALDAASRQDPRRHGASPVAHDLAELLGSLAATAAVRELIDAHLRASTTLAPLIAATMRAWDPSVVAGMTVGLIHGVVERDYLLGRITPIELAANVGALAVALGDEPAAALTVLADERALDYLATDPYLDAASVEAIITAGLLRAPLAGGAAVGESLTALSRLVAITDDDRLNDGATRGVAASMLGFFPRLAPHLDVRIPVVVPHGPDPGDTVEIGSYCDVQRLIGQLLADAPAQVVLGAMTERFRATATAGLATAIAATPAGPAEQRARIAAALADVSAVTALILRSRSARTSLDAYQHGVVVGRAKSVVSWATLITTMSVPTSSTTLRPLIPIASQVVDEALDLGRPPRLPDVGAVAASAVGFTASVVGLPTSTPHIRAALGLGSVPASTWQRLDALLEELDATDDQRRRLAIHSTIVAIAAGDPDLDVYVTQLDVLGGDATNAGPQPPAACG